MRYEKFIYGLNSILTALGLCVRGGRLVDADGQYGSCYSIQGVLSSLWCYFYEKGKGYANYNDMLSDLLLLSDGSNAYYIKCLINWQSANFRYHYKVKVTEAGSISFGTTGKGITGFIFNGTEYAVAPSDELFLAVPSIAVGVYDLYVYSTAADEALTFDCTNCTITLLEYEHCITYVFTSTDYGFVYCKAVYGSVRDMSVDASVNITVDNGLFKLHADREGQYVIYVYCDREDEELQVVEAASGCGLSNRTKRW